LRKIVSALNTFVQEHLMGASTIQQFNREEGEFQKFKHINDDYSTAYLETGHHFALLFSSIDFVQSFVLIFVFSLLVTSSEGFQGGAFFTFSLYIIMIFRPIGDLAERYNLLQSAFTASERIFNILDEEVEYSNHVQNMIGEVKTIEFENVWFSYKPNEWVLKDISFKVNKGETVALVGMTGSGKTTIINLLLRFYEIDKGSIKINGQDIRKYPLHLLRSAMAIVLQDPVIFSGTIAENVSLHVESISEDQIKNALDYANMSPLVRRYPDGIRHKVAERGLGLSTGEKQLLSLARAVAHQRSVLILDEATANIDAATERAIQEALERILKSTTSIVIAHRLSTIHRADQILVIYKGVIREKGTHMELIKQKGIYEKLYRLQYSSFGSIYTERDSKADF
jgi:ATP-binding cassette, subfamily B, multidrug efflux pump